MDHSQNFSLMPIVKLLNLAQASSTYHSVLFIPALVLAIGRIPTQYSVLLSSTSVLTIGNAAYKLLTVAQLINRQGPYTLFSIV